MPYPETEVLNRLVAKVFQIEDVTLGEPARGVIARYRGHLLRDDSQTAYDQLSRSLEGHEITPLFRVEKGTQVIYLVPRKPEVRPARVSVNIILFMLTVLSVMFVGAQPAGSMPEDALGQIGFMARSVLTGLPYAVSLLSILLAHEFGHYLMSRHHHTRATLPYCIPLPLPPLGTMGAAILRQGQAQTTARRTTACLSFQIQHQRRGKYVRRLVAAALSIRMVFGSARLRSSASISTRPREGARKCSANSNEPPFFNLAPGMLTCSPLRMAIG